MTPTNDDERLRYPIGRFQPPASFTPELRTTAIANMARLPADLRALVTPLRPEQLDLTYRPGGWTIRQLAHHLPDSHLNAYLRMKLALTEENPVVKTYDEQLWSELPDVAATPVETSLVLLECLHQRWSTLLRQLPPPAFARTFAHPAWGPVSIDLALAQYTWHGRHHLAHIHLALAASGH